MNAPETPLDAQTAAVVSRLDVDSNTLLLCFGGLALGIGVPPYEFQKTLRSLDAKTMFVRDLDQAWYHRGVVGMGTSLTSAAEGLEIQIKRSKVNRLITLGNSSGGYAALLFGSMLGADQVLSFAPQTALGPISRLRIGEYRWPRQIARVYASSTASASQFNLRKTLTSPNFGSANVYFSSDHRLDRAYAENVETVPRVNKVAYTDRGGHALIRSLKEDGSLDSMLQQVVDGANPQTP